MGLHLVTDVLIGLSYVAISATLMQLARKAKQDMPFLWDFVAFGIFIVSCGRGSAVMIIGLLLPATTAMGATWVADKLLMADLTRWLQESNRAVAT